MAKSLAVLLVLLFFPQLGLSLLNCQMKREVNSTELMLGNATLHGMKVEDGRNSSFIHLFECICGSTELQILDFNSINGFKATDENWYRAEVLRITNCSQLEVRMQKNIDGIADLMDRKVLMFENITDLRLVEFLIGTPSTNADIGTFSCIYFRNVKFTVIPSFISFGDRHEVAFERVSLGETFNAQFKIQIENKNPQIDPVFRMEDSVFKGINDFSQVTSRFVQIMLDSKQKTDQQCSYHYKGSFILRRNRFGFLGLQDVFVKGAGMLEVVNNTFDVMHEYSLDLRNVKSMNITGNNFGVFTKKPFFIAEYDKYVSGCNEPDLIYDDIVNNTFSHNVFVSLKPDDIQFDDPDSDFSSDLISQKFVIEHNGIFKPCDCMNQTFMPPLQNAQPSTPLSMNFNKQIMNSSLCLTHHQPPILGSMTDICDGNIPRDSKEYAMFMKEQLSYQYMDILRDNIENTKALNRKKKNITIALSVVIFLAIIITAIITSACVKKGCC